MTDPGTLALYVHFPWCPHKCPYCDFNSHVNQGTLPEAAYIDQLLRDLDADLALLESTPTLTSIFLGGGTPSLFSPDAIKRLLAGIEARLGLTPGLEITLEANPGTTDYGKFHGFIDAGVSRLSIGVQSFSDPQLQALGRIHSAEEARRAYAAARQAGFTNINLDLMHGLPGQGLGDALFDLDQAIALGPEHLSWYQLTVEKNTAFHRHPPVLPDDDTLWDIYTQGLLSLEQAGFHSYEISAFCRPGQASAHNINYWRFGNYLGIGAGAHGKLLIGDTLSRTTKTRVPKDYLAAPNRRIQRIEQDSLALEFLMNNLRLRAGFDWLSFEASTGLPRTRLDDFVARATARGLVVTTAEGLQPTSQGIGFLNDLLLLVD